MIKFKHSEEGYKYFIGYQEDEIVRSLCIISPQMSGHITLWEKYEDIWCVIKNKLGIKFYSEPIYEKKFLKAKVREFDIEIRTNFLGNGVPKENMYYICISCITIDSVMKMNLKNYPQVYLEECKYKIKKIQATRFVNAQLEPHSDSEADSDSDLEVVI